MFTRPDDSPADGPDAPRAERFSHSGHEVFEILAREHADMLTAYLRSLIGADPSVDDIFQQAMLVAWRRLGDYDRSRPFGPWLRGIAQRLVLEHHRKGKTRPTTTDPSVLAELDGRFDGVNRLPGDTFRQRSERVVECMKKLPEAMREALELVYARGMLIIAAAQSMGASEEATKKRVQRGRQLLAQCVRSGEVEGE
ncbi:MAG TPA: sigma-70 family RNA polymerase sigma factor [Phycisphaerales bacterium]|nr:sigma-70 family RNA polymerase sigma factor [Phycisphaerales bacterium]